MTYPRFVNDHEENLYLVYRTVQVQDDGEVWFTHDPYHRDPLILEALDQPLVPNPGRIPRTPTAHQHN